MNPQAQVYRRRRIAVAVILIIAVFGFMKLVSAVAAVVQEKWEAADKVTPSNPITSSAPPTNNVADIKACADTDIAVQAFFDTESSEFDVTTDVVIHATITNISQEKCARDIGSKSNEIIVLDSNNQQIWSSDFCPVKQQINLAELQPGDVARVTLTWGGNVNPKKCGKTAAHVALGNYSIVARNGETESEPLPLIFIKKAATPSPSN
jgi:hypothetical protein